MRPLVYITMPRRDGWVHAGAAKGFYGWPSSGEAVDIAGGAESEGSLLARSFNDCLCLALGKRDRGEATHMAMLHNDIEPGQFWVDGLWDVMRRTGADLVSAIVCIKENVGNPRTSTAIGLEADPWAVKRFIRRDDLATLPPSFGPEAACGPGEVLLVNSGMWLADLRRPWWDDIDDKGTPFAFTIRDRVIRNADGTRTPEVRSEDWEMSRDLQRAGAKLVVTREVAAIHHGNASWPTL